MKNAFLCWTALACLLVTAGCQTDTGAYEPQSTSQHNAEQNSPFVTLDAATQQSVTTPGIQQATLPDGRLEVTAPVRNRENRRLQVQINCVFKDAQGFAVDETPFQNLFLDENAMETVKFVSMNNQAKKFTVRVRQAR